jgi:hypothetical protein
MMRSAGEPNWVRFHSLPESRRYAETAEERAILLARQNQLAEKVLGQDGVSWLVQTRWTTPDGKTEVTDSLDLFWACRTFGLEFAFEFVDAEEDEEYRTPWFVHAAQTRWKSHAFDDLLWAIADERAGPTLWMSAPTGAVFAPYDGGVDLFLPSAHEVFALKAEHRSWLSAHELGL